MAAFESNPYEHFAVLVIEDERQTRALIKKQLHQIGIVWVLEAADGGAGLSRVLESPPHLILCDIHMEPVGGLEFVQRLRSLENSAIRDTPVVFLTADAQRETVLIARDSRVNGYLVKPVSLWDLKTRIDAIFCPTSAGRPHEADSA
jgi:two-component system chemotaxis response regulator CheY